MNYVVLDLSATQHDGPIKVLGYLDEAGLEKIKASDYGDEIDETQGGWDESGEIGVIWLDEEGLTVAIPVDGLPNYVDSLDLELS